MQDLPGIELGTVIKHSGRDANLGSGLRKSEEHLTFNQGVVGPTPTPLTSFDEPPSSQGLIENQGVSSLGQPTPLYL